MVAELPPAVMTLDGRPAAHRFADASVETPHHAVGLRVPRANQTMLNPLRLADEVKRVPAAGPALGLVFLALPSNPVSTM